jgi:serine/threonine protein kinase/cytochrome c-type biogenesis protein CcmH/NrfG
MGLASGTRLGFYEVLAPLGAGAMGEVYRAHDSRLGRDVAIKLLPEALASSPERLARFEREAKTVAALNHPNIVTLHTIEEAEGIRFIVMELVEGHDLSSLVTPGGLPVDQVLEVAISLADALVVAHERRVVHRDLKPANVMVTRDGRVKVLDFGLAKLWEDGSELGLTQTLTLDSPPSEAGQIMGTVPYMAPEQIRGEEVDGRVDLFAFGVLIYELLAGRRPFTGSSIADVSSAILRDSAPPLGSVRSDLPSDLQRIVGRCLEKNPRQRFQTALDILNELRSLRRVLESSAPQGGKAATASKTSIAVLPFVNRSASPDDEYFSDGLADELLNVLAKIKGLRLSARASSFHFKGKDVPIAEIGRLLNVRTILDGSVRKVGNRVRISVQLVEVADGYQLWSQTYDRTLDDIFAVQDDIAQSVVRELRSTLLGEGESSATIADAEAEVSKAVKGRSAHPEAHRLALQGRYLIERVNRDDTLRGIEHLQESVALDPDYALAWIDLARAYLLVAGYSWGPGDEAVASARDSVERALAIEPELSEGHATLGRIRLYFDWDWQGAEASYHRALELAPEIAAGRHGAGILAQNRGRIDEALDLFRRAVEQDPLSGGAYLRLGKTWLLAQRLVEAEGAIRKAIELAPRRIEAHAVLAIVLLAQGRPDEALEAAQQESERVYRNRSLAAVLHAQERRAEAADQLRAMVEQDFEHGAFQVAEAHALCDDPNAAFEWLQRAYEQRDPGLAEINASYPLARLHGDPRWAAFLKKMGLE